MERERLEEEWLRLTRRTLPELASECGWPIRFDHCFQRVLLDTVHGGVWYDHVKERPAYRHVEQEKLAEAVRLAERIADGRTELEPLNRQSLAWRRRRKSSQNGAEKE